MKRLLPFAVLVALASFASAFGHQDDVSAASKAYNKYRNTLSEPSYGLQKIKRLIAKLKPDQYDNQVLASFNSLSTQEKFTFTMLHGEDMMQNCDAMPPIVGEEHKIFAHEPDAFTNFDAGWSNRQKAFLHQNRAQVLVMLRATMRAHNRVGVNLKNTIVELNAYELIPDLVAIFKMRHKDFDILTVCMKLMKEGKYGPFTQSTSCQKLYGENSNYQSFIDANAANQKLICDRAWAYYRSRKG